LWAKTQTRYLFPLDERPIRDRIAHAAVAPPACRVRSFEPARTPAAPVGVSEVLFIGADCEAIVEAEIVSTEDQEILFLD
jgi:hypothetical protein